jgi:hypothetical protein
VAAFQAPQIDCAASNLFFFAGGRVSHHVVIASALSWMVSDQARVLLDIDAPDADYFTGLGYWTRANPEQCLLATRGKPPREAKDVKRIVVEKRREHSRKPDCVRERIERLVKGPYCN